MCSHIFGGAVGLFGGLTVQYSLVLGCVLPLMVVGLPLDQSLLVFGVQMTCVAVSPVCDTNHILG